MTSHRLAEKDRENRTAVCSVCGPVEIRPAGRGWRCANRKRELARAYFAANPDRRSTHRSPHHLEWSDPQTGTGLCPIDGPVEIVAYGRGYACAIGTRRRGQTAPTPYCTDCRDADRKIIPLVDDECPRCSMSLNVQFAADADLARQLTAFVGDDEDHLVPLVVGQWADPYKMPEYESAVRGWTTLGSRTEVATAV